MYDVSIFTLLSSNDEHYKFRENKTIKIVEKIGEGSIGLVFLLDNGHVLKIYKNSVASLTKLKESHSILPKPNENREIQLFFKIIRYKIKGVGIVQPYSLGTISKEFVFNETIIKNGTYFSVLPFYEKINRDVLVKYNLLDLIKEIIESELNIEKHLQVFHLDIKLENLVLNNGKLMLIDYNLTKSISSGDMALDTNHFNTDKNCKLKLIPLYYVFLLVISLLFNTKKVYFNDYVLVNYLFILSKKLDSCIYLIIYNGLALKYEILGFKRRFLGCGVCEKKEKKDN
jgi:serine/threonine protein kinase